MLGQHPQDPRLDPGKKFIGDRVHCRCHFLDGDERPPVATINQHVAADRRTWAVADIHDHRVHGHYAQDAALAAIDRDVAEILKAPGTAIVITGGYDG